MAIFRMKLALRTVASHFGSGSSFRRASRLESLRKASCTPTFHSTQDSRQSLANCPGYVPLPIL
eukprot:6430406-Amphidinium_carterae.1